MSTTQLSKDDWIQAALVALERGGVAAVRVDVLAKKLGVTRGSFYWHFADRDALVAAAADAWEQAITTDTIDELSRMESPLTRLRTILRLAFFGARAALEPGLAVDVEHPIIAPVIQRVIKTRIDFVVDIFTELGLGAEEARRRALLTYSTFVGWHQLRRTAAGMLPEMTARGEDAEPFVDQLVQVCLAGTGIEA